uniref:CAAX prenyl protease 2/Lysostaphin resistance protein A-like domain-containing protein n=1 Tax=Entomoneis paludosa TaxID=265537 RepID=A0A7S2VEC9_9STRA|mmetsp:Transcript_17007/g.35147  ORF Transcript_17007/g.35147 Transcript_17007/m.35147 type:complete len:523 (+) Transcript_17007:94-1662(+)
MKRVFFQWPLQLLFLPSCLVGTSTLAFAPPCSWAHAGTPSTRRTTTWWRRNGEPTLESSSSYSANDRFDDDGDDDFQDYWNKTQAELQLTRFGDLFRWEWSKVPPTLGGVREYAKKLVDDYKDCTFTTGQDFSFITDYLEQLALEEILKVNEITPNELPPDVSEALFCYFVTGDVDQVRQKVKSSNRAQAGSDKKKKKMKLRLYVRENSEEDRGPLCVLQYRKEEGLAADGQQNNSVVEYYATPNLNSTLMPMSIVQWEWNDIPFSIPNLARIIVHQVSLLSAGLIGCLVFQTRPKLAVVGVSSLLSRIGTMMWKFFLGIDDMDLFSFVSLAIASGFLLGLLFTLLANAGNPHNDFFKAFDLNWLQKQPRGSLSAISAMLRVVGTKSTPLRSVFVSVLFGVLPGACEEFLFRGVIQTVLARSFGMSCAIVFQALLFGIFHYGYSSKGYVLAVSLIGAILGQVYSWTGSLAFPMLLHAGMNLVNTLQVQGFIRSMTGYEISSLISLSPRQFFVKKAQEGDGGR